MTLSPNGSYAPRPAPKPPMSPKDFAGRANESVLDRVIRCELMISEQQDRIGWLTTSVETLEAKNKELEELVAAGGGPAAKPVDRVNDQILEFLASVPEMEFSPLALARNLERKHPGTEFSNTIIASRLKRMEANGLITNVGDKTPFYMLVTPAKPEGGA